MISDDEQEESKHQSTIQEIIQDPIIKQMLKDRTVTDTSEADEQERQSRMYQFLRNSKKYKKIQVSEANKAWDGVKDDEINAFRGDEPFSHPVSANPFLDIPIDPKLIEIPLDPKLFTHCESEDKDVDMPIKTNKSVRFSDMSMRFEPSCIDFTSTESDSLVAISESKSMSNGSGSSANASGSFEAITSVAYVVPANSTRIPIGDRFIDKIVNNVIKSLSHKSSSQTKEAKEDG